MPIFELITGLFQGFVTLFAVILVVPIIVQLLLNMFIGMINNFMRTDIRPILNVIFFPGALLRITFLYFVLRLREWTPKIFYGSAVGTRSPTSASGGYFRGFAISMRPTRAVTFTDVFIISMSGYFVWLIVLIWVLNYSSIMLFLSYLLGYKTASTWYWVIVLTMVVGGMPIPEESLIPVYYLSAYYPHVIISLILNFIAAAILSGIYGPQFGKILFSVVLVITFARFLVDEYRYSKIEDLAIPDYGLDSIVMF